MSTKLATVIADFETQLASAMAPGATSVTIQSATDDDGNALPTGQYFFAIDGNNSQKEHIVCTLTGTSLTNIYSVSRQGIQTSGVARSHRIGSSVSLTDFAHLRYINDLVSGATTFDHTVPLGYDGTASITTANQFATKAYVDGVAISGAPDSSTTVKGITKMSVAPVSPTAPIAVGDNDTRVPTASMAAALAGTGTPASTNPYVNLSTLTGTIVMWGAASAPTGWLLCNGLDVSRTTYAALFAIIGTTFGAGNGTTTFNVPNFWRNVPAGYRSGDSDFGTLGGVGGESTHTLTTPEMPAHTHTIGNQGGGTADGAGASLAAPGSGTSGSTGGGGAHNNLQPYITVNFIIKT